MYGLVLQGGGAKGSFQVGAWKALSELGIPFDAVTGTSIGSLNGALMVQDDFDVAWDLWYNMKPEMAVIGDPKFMQNLIDMDLDAIQLTDFVKHMQQFAEDGGLDITPLRKLINQHIDEQRIRAAKTAFGLVTVSLSDFKPLEVMVEDIPEGKLIEYLLASSNLPVFKTERGDGKIFLDGGFYDNLPVNLMASTGRKKIITIELNGIGMKRKEPDGLEITRIQPSDDLGRILEFSAKRARKNLKMGYYDTRRVFENLHGSRYYLSDRPSTEDSFLRFKQIGEHKAAEISDLIGVEDMPPLRMFFEVLMPKLGEWLKLGKAYDYPDVWMALVERMAESEAVDRFQVVSFEELTQQTKAAIQGKTKSSASVHLLPSIMKQSSLVQWGLKDELLSEIARIILSDQ